MTHTIVTTPRDTEGMTGVESALILIDPFVCSVAFGELGDRP